VWTSAYEDVERACRPQELDLVSGSQPRAALGVVEPIKGGLGDRYLWMAGEGKRGGGQRERGKQVSGRIVHGMLLLRPKMDGGSVGWWGTIDSFDDCGQQNNEGAAVR
jgi:hypothetical protein